MWPLIKKFFTTESYAVRLLRLVGVGMGMAIAAEAGPVWLPDWVGYIIGAVAAVTTGTNSTPSGIPKK